MSFQFAQYALYALLPAVGIGAILFGRKSFKLRLPTKLATGIVVVSGVLLMVVGAGMLFSGVALLLFVLGGPY